MALQIKIVARRTTSCWWRTASCAGAVQPGGGGGRDPRGLFAAVAEILAYVYSLKGKK